MHRRRVTHGDVVDASSLCSHDAPGRSYMVWFIIWFSVMKIELY